MASGEDLKLDGPLATLSPVHLDIGGGHLPVVEAHPTCTRLGDLGIDEEAGLIVVGIIAPGSVDDDPVFTTGPVPALDNSSEAVLPELVACPESLYHIQS
jgi:hypothetical protein